MLLDRAEGDAAELGLTEIRLYTNEAMTENLSYYPRMATAKRVGPWRMAFGVSTSQRPWTGHDPRSVVLTRHGTPECRCNTSASDRDAAVAGEWSCGLR